MGKLKYGFLSFMLILSSCSSGMANVDNIDEITQINSLDNDRNQMINESDYDNLSLFLFIDQTDKNEYLPWYTCGHYSRSLARNLSLFSEYNLTIGSIILSNHPTLRGYQNHIMNYMVYKGEILLIGKLNGGGWSDEIHVLSTVGGFKYYRLYPDGTQVPSYWDGPLAHTGVIGVF